LVLGEAPNGKALSAAFLADFAGDYDEHGKAIFELIREKYPVEYFRSLVTLAKVLKIELGPPDSFDRPASTAEALDRLEQRAGPQARALLEKFLGEVAQVEQRYLEDQSESE
jgi:hypothetical protein